MTALFNDVNAVHQSTGDFPQRSRVCAVIVTYNIGKAIHRCFDVIEHQVGHVLIIDNASDQATRQQLDKLAESDSVTLILNERNEGIAHAYNQAVQWAQGKEYRWILTLDHDSEATPGMVQKLVETFTSLEQQGIQNVGLVGSNPYDVNAQRFTQNYKRNEGHEPLEGEETVSSGSLLSLRVFDTVDPFNEDLFIYYVDTEFCIRLARAGFRIYICLEAVLLHREGAVRCHRFLWRHAYHDHYGKTARYFLTRNMIYMMRRYPVVFDDVWWVVRKIFKDHAKILVYGEEPFGTLWYSLRGLVDGLKGKVGPLDPGKSPAPHNALKTNTRQS